MIDTLSIVRKLSDSGVKREQAEAHAEAIANAIDQQYGELATKDFVRNQISIVRGEIGDLRGDMNSAISDLRGDMNSKVSALDAKVRALETRLVYWIVGTGLVVVGLCGTALTIFLNIYGGGSP